MTRMIQKSWIVLFAVGLLSCNSGKNVEKEAVLSDTSKNNQHFDTIGRAIQQDDKSQSSHTLKHDSINVSEACVVLAQPNNSRIEKFKISAGKNYDTALDDWMYYLATSREYFQKQKVKIIETEADIITFIKTDGTKKRIDFTDAVAPWNVLLFNGQDDPQEADMTNPEAAFQEVMRK